jgi:tRNA nucleotidyltransferase (CCA-adding enzyme)
VGGAIGTALLARLSSPVGAFLDDLGGAAARGGARLWLVGGAVRDLWLGESVADLDLVIEGPFEAAVSAIAAAGHGVTPKAAAFLTYALAPRGGLPGLTVDLGATRRERYPRPAALPLVEAGSFEDDLRRRDVSVNAIGVSLHPDSRGALADPAGGLVDLAAGRLRVLHARSFEDDPTRAFRLARLGGRHGFEVDPATAGRLVEAVSAGLVGRLSPARVRAQAALLAAEPALAAPLAWHARLGLLAAIHPSLDPDAAALGRAGETDAAAAALAALGVAAGAPLGRLLRALLAGREGVGPVLGRLGFAGAPAERLAREAAEAPAIAGALATLGARARHDRLASLDPAALPVVAAIAPPEGRAALVEWATELRGRRPRLAGRDLIALGVPPGPEVGRMLDRLLTERLEGHLTRRSDEVTFVRRALANGRLH